MKYTALQVKTSYSLLSSLNKIEKLVSRAVTLGYTSLAITDHNNMFGVPEFYQECKKNNIKPIIGLELEVGNKNILLYAMNNQGYKNLIKLSTTISEREIPSISPLRNEKQSNISQISFLSSGGENSIIVAPPSIEIIIIEQNAVACSGTVTQIVHPHNSNAQCLHIK